MDKGTNFVDKHQYFLLKNLSHLSEMSDITKSKNSTFFFTFNHRIHTAFSHNISTNNLSSSTSEDYW